MPDRPRTGTAAILIIGVLYIVIGLVTAEMAKHGGLAGTRAWRLIAWLTSGITYGAQIGYERLRLGAPLRRAAVRAALASALGAFGLAVAANVHSARLHIGKPSLYLALAVWPAMTFVAAFLVALAVSAALRPPARSR